MSLIRPFKGLRPDANHIAQVIAPPYDVLNSQEARQRAQNKPWSFLHISKPEIDLPENINPYDDAVYAKGAENFDSMLLQRILQPDEKPGYYIYRLTMGAHQQTGLVAVASVQAYQQQRIRKHEQTQPQKVTDRIKQIEALDAQTGPVLLTFRAQPAITALFDQITQKKAQADVTADDNVRHQLWLVEDENLIEKITTAFETVDNLYIADGHHRSEAASEIAKINSAAEAQYFLSVIFPDNQLQILSYNRVVKDLNGLTADQFLEKLKTHFKIEASAQPVQPKKPGQFGMFLRTQPSSGQWYLLSLLPDNMPKAKSKDSLDVSLLATYVLEPILNIKDPRRDPRIEFVGGIRGLTELEKRVTSGDMAVAFSYFQPKFKK